MPDGLAPQVIAMGPTTDRAAGPLVFATFLEHYLTPKKRDAEGKRTAGSEDLMYDEGKLKLRRVANFQRLRSAR